MISKLVVIVGVFVACSVSIPVPQPWPHEWISEILMMMPGMVCCAIEKYTNHIKASSHNRKSVVRLEC